MDGAVLTILLLTGFCVLCSSFPNVYYFINNEMTWDEAQNYCLSEYFAMAQIQNRENVTAMKNTATGGYTDKAWIGLFANDSEWTWINGQPSNWTPCWQGSDEFCAVMDNDLNWTAASCSDKRPFVCYKGGDVYDVQESRRTWKDAVTSCKEKRSVLVSFSKERDTKRLHLEEKAWIGLYRRKLWFWSESGENNEFNNWQKGQPDELNKTDTCAAVALTDGRWTEEQCDAKYPFFCSGVYKARKTVVGIKIQSSKNMEDPAYSADLLKQLRAALAKQGVTDFQLTWKKLPAKTVSSESSIRCLMKL